MPDIRISEAEMEALDGQPLAVRCAYVFAIRPWMDYATGYVGIKRRISYRSIAEALEVEPEQGRHADNAGKPSKSAVRHIIRFLERRGLLVNKSVGKSLIFYLPIASQDKSALNKSDTSATHKSAPNFDRYDNDLKNMSDTPAHPMSDTHPVSGIGSTYYQYLNQIGSSNSDQDRFGLGDAIAILISWGMPQSFIRNNQDRELVKQWIDVGVTGEQLFAACERATLAKQTRNDSSPIGPRYIHQVLKTLSEQGNEKSRGSGSGIDILAAGCVGAFK